MSSIYGCDSGTAVFEVFSFGAQTDYASVVSGLEAGTTWTGRIYPLHSKQGIASVEVMVQCDAEAADKFWIYTLEHPKVDNEVRFSSRSELQMLRVLLDNTLEYVFFRDVEGHIILTNKAFRKALEDGGKVPGVDFTIEDFVSEESAAWMRELDEKVRDTGMPVVNMVSRVAFSNGLEQWLQLSTVPVRSGEGEMIGSLSVARDISDLKRTEDELRLAIDHANEASRAKGEFLAAMSHEIRTPINGIIGASELCQETRLDPEQRGLIDTVLQCGSTLLAIVNDVLDFSKIEAGQLNLEKLNFSPHSLIENVAEGFVQQTRKKGLELISTYDDDLPAYLMGDPTRLKQVLYNLVGNAVKFTDVGEIVIRAETTQIEENIAKVKFSVSDTGIGISESRKEAIFHSFTQADMSTTRKYGGTGLGLSICRELVQLMDGEIEVSSKIGQGSTFSFEIPFEVTRHPGAEAVPYNPELAGMRVLIVDDNFTNRDIYQQMCSGWGYRSEAVKDAISALNKMEEALVEGDAFDLLILDQQMPGLTGLDLAGLIKSRPELRSAELLLLSSSLDRSESERAAEIGVARALSKPVKRRTLLEVILETFGVGDPDVKTSVTASPIENIPMDILLTEDNPVNQSVAIQRLKKLGHKVTLAEDGQQALDYVKKRRYDCILMDIQMPGMDGYETTASIRNHERKSGMEPQYIVAMTAHAMKGDEELCRAAGMDDYLPKPFRVERLKEVLLKAAREDASGGSAGISKDRNFSAYLKTMDEEDRGDLLAAARIFVETLPRDIANLERAVELNDFKQIYSMAHTLKGVVGIFGDNKAVTLAEALEHAAEQELGEYLQPYATSFVNAAEWLKHEVDAELCSVEEV